MYVQKRRFKPPRYDLYETISGGAFACEVRIPELTGQSTEVNSNPTVFGSSAIFYRKKQTAKNAAAHEAVEWIWKHDPIARDDALAASLKSGVGTGGSCMTYGSNGSTVELVIPQNLAAAEAPQLAAWLCPKLRLCALEYSFENTEHVPTMFDATGLLRRIKPPVGIDQVISLGPIRNIHGKPTARARVAELAIYWMVRRESKRLGVKIVGLKPDFYEEDEGEEESEEEQEGEGAVVGEDDDTMSLA